jgi:hypothetical protein
MKEKLVTVARFTDYIQADLARQTLEDEGVVAFVLGQNFGNVYSGVPAAVDIKLQTPESQAQEAQAILEARAQEWQQDGAPESDEDLGDEPEPLEAADEEQE